MPEDAPDPVRVYIILYCQRALFDRPPPVPPPVPPPQVQYRQAWSLCKLVGGCPEDDVKVRSAAVRKRALHATQAASKQWLRPTPASVAPQCRSIADAGSNPPSLCGICVEVQQPRRCFVCRSRDCTVYQPRLYCACSSRDCTVYVAAATQARCIAWSNFTPAVCGTHHREGRLT
eukprot:365057-Chlamydomonas_euryale.AAC.15